MRRLRLGVLSASLAAALSGCYAQRSVSPVALQPGDELTIVLSAEGRERLDETSTRGGDQVTGQLVSLTTDSLAIAARLDGGVTGGAVGRSNLRQTLSFARENIERVTTPEFDRGRTAVVVGALVAVTTWLVIELFDVGDQGPGTVVPPPGPPAPFGPGG